MLKRLCSKFQYKKINNKGSAMVVVIIAIAFVAMLATMLTFTAYRNYTMKYTDRSAKNNFYSAESALDEINVGLQADISEAATNAYADIMKISHSLGENQAKEKYRELFKENFENLVNPMDGANTRKKEYMVEHLCNYLVTTPINGRTVIDGNIISYGAVVSSDALDNKYYFADDDYLYLYGIEIEYSNEDGFVSIISTDIVIEVPNLSFVAKMEKPDLQLYSIVANENLISKSNIAGVEISGSVYGGKKGVQVMNNSKLNFKYADTDPAGSIFTVTAENLNATNGGLITNKDHQMWLKNINVTTANVDLGGSLFVKDDLNIDGTDVNGIGSNVKLKGEYYGYGDSFTSAENSSSILINGAQTALDMSEVTDLMLAGHAYVGARHYNPSTVAESDYIENLSALEEEGNGILEEDTGLPENEQDIALGQSVAMKSDQLIYLVPKECMCYDRETDTQALAKNPLTYDEYLKYTTTYIPQKDADGNIVTQDQEIQYTDELKYNVVDLAKTFNKMNASLQSKYGVTYRPVFRKVNGSVLVYYYLFFDTETQANQFFADYYEADPETIQNYARSYVRDFKINTSLGEDAENFLSLAGNMLYVNNEGELTFKADTFEEDVNNYDELVEQRETYSETFEGLSHYLLKNSESLSAEQLQLDVYSNIMVEEDEFEQLIGGTGSRKVFEGTTGSKSIVINNKDTDAYYVSDLPEAKVIIASGDVVVDVAKFAGLIIAGGDVTLDGRCIAVTYDATAVTQSWMNKNGETFMYEVLKNGIAYANVTGLVVTEAEAAEIEKARKEDEVRLVDLIQYDNWSKE